MQAGEGAASAAGMTFAANRFAILIRLVERRLRRIDSRSVR
jgi:hypothetical protein